MRRVPFVYLITAAVSISTLILGSYFIQKELRLKQDALLFRAQFLITQFTGQVSYAIAQSNAQQLEQIGKVFIQDPDLALLTVVNSRGQLLLNLEKNRKTGQIYELEEKGLLKALSKHKLDTPYYFYSQLSQNKHLFLATRLSSYWSNLFQKEYHVELKEKATEHSEDFGYVVMGFDLENFNKGQITNAAANFFIILFAITFNLLLALKYQSQQDQKG